MNSTAFLTKPVTRADLIGSLLTTPLVAWAAIVLPAMYELPAKYAEIFSSFNAPLPTELGVFLAVGGAGLVTAFVLLVLAPVAVLLFSRRPWAKLLTPVACGVVVLLLQYALVKALLEATLQIMQRLPG